MTLGGYTLHLLDAGHFALDGGAMFGIIPQPLWSRQIPPDASGRVPMRMRCLLLEGHGRCLLVDTGLGDKYDDKFARIYDVDDRHASLLRSLKQAGFGPGDVTDVVLTHLHFDHAGGGTTRRLDGTPVPTFPNATYHVQATHWAWAHESPRERASFFPENLAPLEASGQLHLTHAANSAPGALFPHLELRTVHGHTRGMQLPTLVADGQTVFFAADLLPTTAHVPLLWIMAYDIAPLETLAEKERLLAQAADEAWTVVFEHDAATAVGRIVRTARGDFAVADGRLAW